MRLWHIDLISYIPNLQLVAQWRELCSIYAKQDKHILINYVYNYPKDYLGWYSDEVIREINRRGIKIKSFDKYREYFGQEPLQFSKKRFSEHNFVYLRQCYYNLEEKYQRGQKDFDEKTFNRLQCAYFRMEDAYDNYGGW